MQLSFHQTDFEVSWPQAGSSPQVWEPTKAASLSEPLKEKSAQH